MSKRSILKEAFRVGRDLADYLFLIVQMEKIQVKIYLRFGKRRKYGEP